jgi:RNA polymerase sigma factor (sigma-70 family)
MESAGFASVLRYARTLADTDAGREFSDRELLEQYVHTRAKAPLTLLVHRHAGLVAGVCRRMLDHSHDVEDAVQATFLVLMRQADTIRKRESAASWLHGVARRICSRLRSRSANRRTREREFVAMSDRNATPEMNWDELLVLLDQAIGELPEKYRDALVLCYLQGKTQEQAARLLRCPRSSLASRLARARALLQERFTIKGIALPAALVAVLLCEKAGPAAVSARLTLSTLQILHATDGGVRVAGNLASCRAPALANEFGQFLLSGKATFLAVLLFGLGLGLTGVGLGNLLSATAPNAQEANGSDRPATLPSALRATVATPRPTDLYGDPLPPHALARMGTVRPRHGARISQISFVGNGRLVATAGKDQTIRLWNGTTGELVKKLGPIDVDLECAALSPDGAMLIGKGPDGDLSVWSLAGGQEVVRLKSLGWPINRIAVSYDGRALAAAGSGHSIAVWKLPAGQLVSAFETRETGDELVSLAVAPNGKQIATCTSFGVVHLWDTSKCRPDKTIRLVALKGEDRDHAPPDVWRSAELTYSPDGSTLAASGHLRDIVLYDTASGKIRQTLPSALPSSSFVAFSPDSKHLVTGEEPDGVYRLWDLVTGTQRFSFAAGKVATHCAAFSPDGETLAISALDGFCLCQVRDGRQARMVFTDRAHSGAITSSAILSDQQTMVTASADRTLRWWEITTGREIRHTPFTEGGNKLLPLSIPRTELEQIIENQRSLYRGPAIVAGGKQVLFGESALDSDNKWQDLVRLKDLRDLKPVPLGASLDPNATNQLLPGGIQVLIHIVNEENEQTQLALHDRATGNFIREIAQLKGIGWQSVCSPDGRLAATYRRFQPDSIEIFDLSKAKHLLHIPLGAEVSRALIAFSPDSGLLAYSHSPDPLLVRGRQFQRRVNIHLWNLRTGQELGTFGSSESSYVQAAFSADGRMLATADLKNRITVWETGTGEARMSFKGHAGAILQLLFAKNDSILLSTSADTTALAWDLTGERLREQAERKPTPFELQHLWEELSSADAALAYEALCSFLAQPEVAISQIEARLPLPTATDVKAIQKLIAELDASAPRVRERASEELAGLGRVTEPALRHAAADHLSPEQSRRVRQLLEQLERGPTSPELQAMRAVELLERIGDVRSRTLLTKLAQGTPEAVVTSEAKKALARLSKKAAGE